MKHARMLVLAAFFLAIPAGILSAQAASSPDPWAPVRFLLGDWTTEGLNKPEEGEGVFSFSPELEGNIVVRRNRVEFPPDPKGNRGFFHEDLLLIYPEAGKFRAIYFDNEKHVIEYALTFPEKENVAVFETRNEAGPRFKLLYRLLPDRILAVEFYIAQPGGEYNLYMKGLAKRISKK